MEDVITHNSIGILLLLRLWVLGFLSATLPKIPLDVLTRRWVLALKWSYRRQLELTFKMCGMTAAGWRSICKWRATTLTAVSTIQSTLQQSTSPKHLANHAPPNITFYVHNIFTFDTFSTSLQTTSYYLTVNHLLKRNYNDTIRNFTLKSWHNGSQLNSTTRHKKKTRSEKLRSPLVCVVRVTNMTIISY